MTLKQKKAKRFGDAIKMFERFKAEWKERHPDATEEQYRKAIAQKAEELDL